MVIDFQADGSPQCGYLERDRDFASNLGRCLRASPTPPTRLLAQYLFATSAKELAKEVRGRAGVHFLKAPRSSAPPVKRLPPLRSAAARKAAVRTADPAEAVELGPL